MPIGKKKTALTDAIRKKENSFNRCQSEKSTIKKFRFPNDATDCILRIRSLTIFSTSPISNKMWATLFFREHFSFSTNILPKSKTLTHVIKADRTFVIWTKGSQHSVANQDLQQEVTATSSYEKHIKLRKSKQWR